MRRFILLLSTLLILLLSCTMAWAKEPATPEFTIQQAVDKALVNSKSLKQANYDVDRSSEVRDKAEDNVSYTPSGPGDETAVSAFTGLVQADINWRMAKRTLGTQEDSIVMQTYKAYNTLLQAQEKVKVSEAQVKNTDLQRIIASVSYRVGLLNNLSLLQAETTAETAKANLEAANKSLEDSYQKFNQLLGLWPEDRPVLTEWPKVEELKVDDLDYEVKKVVNQSPTVWLAQQKIDLARLVLNTYNGSSSSESFKTKEIDVDKAELSAADTDEQLRKAVRTIYYTTKQLEQQYLSAQQSVRVAEESLRVVKVKYEVGMAVQADVVAAEVTLAQAKQSLLDISAQHLILAYAFQKPWTYS